MKQQEFFDQYASIAMEQQIRYGIPASVTLAQMALESGWGESNAARNSNNFFGVKVGSTWKGAYDLYTDDEPNEKFRRYDNVTQSVEDHSKVLMGNRYKNCHGYDSTDYINWTKGIKNSGYARDKDYVTKILSVIETHGLNKYDQMAVTQARQQSLPIGYMRGVDTQVSNGQNNNPYLANKQQKVALAPLSGTWCLPMDFSGLRITGEYGEKRSDHTHQGIDISTNKQQLPLFATENNGLVTKVGNQPDGAGHYIKVEYTRQDNSKYEVTYMHLSSINVNKGQTVQAGEQIAVSGNSGRSSGPHLHIETAYKNNDGNWQKFDPKLYLAEIEVRGNINTSLNKNGQDILAQYRSQMEIEPSQQQPLQQNSNMPSMELLANITNSNDPTKWLGYLMSNNHESSSQRDIVSELISTMFSAAMSVALTLRTTEEVEAEEKARNEMVKPQDNTVVKMSRETIDVQKAQQTVSAIFETESPENTQQNTLRQA